MTAGLIHYVLNLLHITVHIRDVCVFLAPVFSGLTAISTFLLTRELWNQGAGLLAACFIAIVPGYISRSVAGSFDNEGIAIFALQFTYYLWVCTLSILKMQKIELYIGMSCRQTSYNYCGPKALFNILISLLQKCEHSSLLSLRGVALRKQKRSPILMLLGLSSSIIYPKP